MNGLDQKPSDPPTVCVRCGEAVCNCPDDRALCRVPLCVEPLAASNTTGLCAYHEKEDSELD